MKRFLTASVSIAAAVCLSQLIAQQQLTREQKVQFLQTAKVKKTKGTAQGITGVVRATLTDGTLTHDCSIQRIDEFKTQFQTAMGTELNFKDSWKFNVAAYKLDRLLGLNMSPVTIARPYQGQSASYCWWVDDVLMVELERMKKKVKPQDPDKWNKQMHAVRVFDQLIYNTDRNLGNLIIDKSWDIWMIDHSRAFRIMTDIKEPKNLVMCDKDLLDKMKALDEGTLKKELGEYLNQLEIKGLLVRRDKIVKLFEAKGPSALYTMPRRP